MVQITSIRIVKMLKRIDISTFPLKLGRIFINLCVLVIEKLFKTKVLVICETLFTRGKTNEYPSGLWDRGFSERQLLFLWKIKEVLSFLLFLGLKVNTHEVYL